MIPVPESKNKRFFFYLFCILTGLAACKSDREKQNELPDSPYRGTITISADESFKPVVDQLVKVYESSHAKTTIHVLYKPEAECLKDFGVDSIRMVIATRSYNADEKEFMVDSLGVSPESMTVARDAVAVIVNPAATDSLFTMKDLKDLLTGKYKDKLIPVFDGVKATSTVRYIIDSVLHGDSLTPAAVAARSSEGVIDYVAQNTDVVGFIGISWIGNPEDGEQLSFLKKVRVASLMSTYRDGGYVKAYQQNIYTKSYPMVRDLIYTLKENYKGLGYGFAGFMSGEIGQLIFRRAYLVPQVLKNFGVRPIKLKK
jgi:phosphate transport system substrate-binding protein